MRRAYAGLHPGVSRRARALCEAGLSPEIQRTDMLRFERGARVGPARDGRLARGTPTITTLAADRLLQRTGAKDPLTDRIELLDGRVLQAFVHLRGEGAESQSEQPAYDRDTARYFPLRPALLLALLHAFLQAFSDVSFRKLALILVLADIHGLQRATRRLT